MEKEIKVKVMLTEGYQQRFTEAACAMLRKRERNENKGGIRNATAFYGRAYDFLGATDRVN